MEKNKLRRKGYSEVAIWELEVNQNIKLNLIIDCQVLKEWKTRRN